MFQKLFTLWLGILFIVTSVAFAQNQLDPRPLDPEIDPDIDMYIGSWKESIPYNTHGTLTERAILTRYKGDPLEMKPHRKGAVLMYTNRFSRATLDAHASTTPTTLTGEQEIFYFTSGKGFIKAGGETAELRDGIFVLMPEGLEFTITNTSDEILVMYLINEPLTEGFQPNKEMVVKDEKTMPFRESGYITGKWNHNGKNIFGQRDGLASHGQITLMTINVMTIGQPHSHDQATEEVWTVIEGKNLAFIGKEIRWQYPGTAYLIPPNEFTPHTNINTTEKPIKILLFATHFVPRIVWKE